MKSVLISLFWGVVLCSLANCSGASYGDQLDLKNSNLNDIGHEHFGDGSAELMPGRDLSTQELKNLVYITMQEYFEDQKKSNSQDVDSELQDSVKRLLRPKRFVLMPFARSDDATNIGGGPIVNFWQRWAQRRLQRIQRRRQRWENFRQRQQTFFQSIGRRTAETSQRLQASLSTNNLSNGGVGEVTNAGSGHRIVMSSKVPPTGSGVDRPLTTA